MKKISLLLSLFLLLIACKSQQTTKTVQASTAITIDLVNITDDKVQVMVMPKGITTETTTFFIPKIIPGTYSADDYGKFIENLKAFDANGNELTVSKRDVNSWDINNAKALHKLTYDVNDTYDIEKTHSVFSPAGTNIDKDKNFMLNLHGFVGYFKDYKKHPYTLNINHPAHLTGNSALVDMDPADNKDLFKADRYFELVDNPIMYAEGNSETFMVGDMEILLSVYSPSKTLKASDLKPNLEKMMKAQKAFMGTINANKKYCILLYMSKMGDNDANGFGALEHHNSTTVVFPEAMPLQALHQSMKDVVSHEFFHIITPLSIHSEEIHYFDYNQPKMSEHLWMYEGVTEYFANLFQINQGLINNSEFYERIMQKVGAARGFDDHMSFTTMSKNILQEPYKSNYLNVYQKGALIGMCVDILIREQSNGEKGIIDLMKSLSDKYGIEKPFLDAALIDDVTALSYPEVKAFLQKHVVGNTPIDYNAFFAKAGLKINESEARTGYLMKDMQTPYFTVDQDSGAIVFIAETNSFLKQLGVQAQDRIVTVNGTKYDLKNIQQFVMNSFAWQDGQDIEMVVKRQDKEVVLKGKVTAPMGVSYNLTEENLPATDARVKLRKAWMTN